MRLFFVQQLVSTNSQKVAPTKHRQSGIGGHPPRMARIYNCFVIAFTEWPTLDSGPPSYKMLYVGL